MTGARWRVGDRFGPARFGPITAEQVAAFATASGDRNPIHLDAEAARRIGLEGPPVHGMQLVALMHEAVVQSLPGAAVTSLATRFLAPVPVGSAVDVSGRIVGAEEADGRTAAILRLFLRRVDGTLASIGEARLQPSTAAP
jgi:acyl dehydratase